MSPKTSRLSTLLRVRRIQEELRRAHLAGEVSAERRAQRLLVKAHERYAATAAEPALSPEPVAGFLSERHHRGVLAGAVSDAGTRVQTAAEVTVVARRDWSEAAIRLTALERLEDRALETAATERLAVEQRTSEESSSAQHTRALASSAKGKRS
jgi:hypothetical protein